MYLLVSLLQLNALVVGNGSYMLQPCGHDLHGLTVGMHHEHMLLAFTVSGGVDQNLV